MPLRIRREELPAQSRKIGEIDYIDQTHGHKSFLATPLAVHGDVGYVDRICFDEKHPGPPYNIGGPFFSRETRFPSTIEGTGKWLSASGQPPHGAATRPNCGGVWRVQYTGGFTSDYNVFGAPALPGESISSPEQYDSFSNRNDLSSLGNRGYSKLRPKIGKANILQDIYELRDAPRTLKTTVGNASTALKRIASTNNGKAWDIRDVIGASKRSADEFVNFQFGWKPTVNSLITACDAVIRADEYFAKIKRGNDRWQKREFHEDDIQSEVLNGSWLNQSRNFCTPHMDSASGWIVPGTGHFRTYRTQITRVWYAGSFKYYRPEFDDDSSGIDPLRQIRQYGTLLGANLNATTVFKVMPWTWLADWFVNASDFVQRVEDLASQGVVARYLYLMRETFDAYRINTRFTLQSGPTLDLSWFRSVTVKRRIGSNSPFNFTLLPSSLTTTQLAILGAMGLSHIAG